MTKEDKELLFRDLCARLPYGIKGLREWVAPVTGSPEEMIDDFSDFDIKALTTGYYIYDGIFYEIKGYDFKPYLFPMSSMTKEQIDEIYIDSRVKADGYDILDSLMNDIDAIDWLNKNHFDYRGLIEKGLALDATGLNIY